MDTRLLIGLGSGLVSGLILASAGGGSLPGLIFLFFLSPLPIAITGLCWGWLPALVAALSAGAVLALGIAPQTGFTHLIAIGLPISALTYLTLLHRDQAPQALPNTYPQASAQRAFEWYPIGRVLTVAALLGGVLATLALLSIGTSRAELEAEIRQIAERMFHNAPMPKSEVPSLTPQDIERFTTLMTDYFGWAASMTWLTLAALNLWLGGHVARLAGLLQRPWPDLSTIQAPRGLSVVFALAVLLSFVADYPGLIAASFVSAILMVYVFVGLAIIHNLTRGNPYRIVMLIAVYVAALFLQPLSGFALAILALAEPYLPSQLRRKGPFDADLPPPPPS